MKKVISTHEDRKKVVFWDSVDESEASEASTTFTGLRFKQNTFVFFYHPFSGEILSMDL